MVNTDDSKAFEDPMGPNITLELRFDGKMERCVRNVWFYGV